MDTGGVVRVIRRISAAAVACVLAVLSASFLAPGTACACSCAPYDAAEAAANAAVIVVGTPVESRDGRYGRQYVVQVGLVRLAVRQPGR